MRVPQLTDFGITQADTDWAKSVESRIPVGCMFVSATGVGLYGLLTATSFHPGMVLLWLFFAFIPMTLFLGLLLLLPAEAMLKIFVPRYGRAQRFLDAEKALKAAWVRTQLDFWRSLSGTQFEAELAALFRRAGFRAELTRSSGDQGVDIWLYDDSGRRIVQCEAHRMPIGPAVARELFGTLQHFKVTEAILASTSGFTSGVVEYVRDKPIQLLGPREIVALQEKHGL